MRGSSLILCFSSASLIFPNVGKRDGGTESRVRSGKLMEYCRILNLACRLRAFNLGTRPHIYSAYAGIFTGLEAAMHFKSLENLKDACHEFDVRVPGSKVTTIVPTSPDSAFRYVKI
jgi:hypothetical protein